MNATATVTGPSTTGRSPRDSTVLRVDRLHQSFGQNEVLSGVDLDIASGQTVALLGRNGEGKTTLIRTLLGLLPLRRGKIEVLGLDPHADGVAVRQRVGYLAEDQQMWPWMRVEQLLRFMAPFYPTWDHDLARDLHRRFELPTRTRIKHLSKGQNVRLGLVLALAHRPALAILDDPALGLDPVARKQFNRDLVQFLQGQGAAVFYSSHLLGEVEAVADRVAILNHGRIVIDESPDTLRQRVKRLVFDTPSPDLSAIAQSALLDVQRLGRETAVTVRDAGSVLTQLRLSGNKPRVVDLALDDIFEALVDGRPDLPEVQP